MYGEVFSPVSPFKRCPGTSQFQSQPNIRLSSSKAHPGRVKTEDKDPDQEPEAPSGVPGFKSGQNQGHSLFLAKGKNLLRFCPIFLH